MRSAQRGLATLAGTGLLLMAALGLPPPADAFPLDGCTLTLTSYDAAGKELDTAVGGEADASIHDPLWVPWDGVVRWTRGDAGQASTSGSWHVEVFGLPTPLRGPEAALAGDSVRVRDSLPFRFAGLFFVSGELAEAGESCRGSGWLRVVGDPLSTLPFSVGLTLLLVGLVMLAVGTQGRWLAGLLGGLMVGTGSALLLVIHAILPLAELTPLAAIGAGLVIGLASGWYGRIQSRGRAPRRAGAPG
jgi:hypothetical protein